MNYLKVEPKQYQLDGVAFALPHFYSMIGDDMGLGKSLQGILAFLQSRARKLLILCPSSLKVNWENEIKKLVKKQLKVQVFKTGKSFEKFDSSNDVFIASYSLAHCAEEVVKVCDYVICDEAHNLKNPEAQRTEAVHNLIWNYSPRRLTLLTGTPYENRIPELYSLLCLLSYDRLRTNGMDVLAMFPTYEKFCDHFCFKEIKTVKTRYGTKRIPKYFGCKDPEGLKRLLNGKLIRRMSKDVFPKNHIIEKDVLLPGKKIAGLVELLEDLKRGDQVPNATLKAKNALFTAPLSAEYAIDIYEEVGSPVIIFTDHIDATHAAAQALSKYRVARIDGQTPMAQRDKIDADFQAGKYDFLVCTYRSMGTGRTLTASWNMVLNDPPYVPGILAQTKKRIDRIGQEKVPVYHYIAGSPVSMEINILLRDKEKDLAII